MQQQRKEVDDEARQLQEAEPKNTKKQQQGKRM